MTYDSNHWFGAKHGEPLCLDDLRWCFNEQQTEIVLKHKDSKRIAIGVPREICAIVNAYRDIKAALGTDEDCDALVEVARNAHRAEKNAAAFERLVGTISRMEEREPSEEAEIDALDTMNRLIEESRKILKTSGTRWPRRKS